MITADRNSLISQDAFCGTDKHAKLSFSGKSTDTKPTETWEGIKIDNGSTFLEVDTQKLFFYDEEGKTWN